MRREGESRREDEKEKVEDAVGSRHWVKEQVSIKEIFGELDPVDLFPFSISSRKITADICAYLMFPGFSLWK